MQFVQDKRDAERKTEITAVSQQRPFIRPPTPRKQAAHSAARRAIACVTREIERKKTTEKDTVEVNTESCRITHWK